jgi:intracellular septation protein A
MPRRLRPSARELLVELGLYAVLVAVYLWGVLLLIADRVAHLAADPGVVYAMVALALIVGQGFLLDVVVETMLRLVRSLLARD